MSAPQDTTGPATATRSRPARSSAPAAASATTPTRGLTALWQSWSLAKQFVACASLVLVPTMWVIGIWVSDRIKDGATSRAGTSAALYMENFIEPLVQEMATADSLSEANQQRLGDLLKGSTIGNRVHTLKMWGKGGVVVASSRASLVGRQFTPSASLKRAWSGIVTASFDNLGDEENKHERQSGMPLLEVYVPIRERGSERVIVVAEFYEVATDLKIELDRARRLSWIVVSALTLSMLSALLAIVRRGSRTIEEQRTSLEQRIGELTSLLAENRRLRARAHRASANASESNEALLRRLGSELHDGPAQLISVALLRMNEPQAGPDDQQGVADTQQCLRGVLTDALKDIRNIAAGLAVPEIDSLSLDASLRDAVERHRRLTNTDVSFCATDLPDPVPHAVKLCAFRFVQEALSNAYRHAGGAGQTVAAAMDGDCLMLRVTDAGGRERAAPGPGATTGLGLKGLQDRIESVGGSLDIDLGTSQGGRVTARIPIRPGTL